MKLLSRQLFPPLPHYRERKIPVPGSALSGFGFNYHVIRQPPRLIIKSFYGPLRRMGCINISVDVLRPKFGVSQTFIPEKTRLFSSNRLNFWSASNQRTMFFIRRTMDSYRSNRTKRQKLVPSDEIAWEIAETWSRALVTFRRQQLVLLKTHFDALEVRERFMYFRWKRFDARFKDQRERYCQGPTGICLYWK